MTTLAWRNVFRASLRHLFTAVVTGLNLLAICSAHAALGPTPEDRLAQWGALIEAARDAGVAAGTNRQSLFQPDQVCHGPGTVAAGGLLGHPRRTAIGQCRRLRRPEYRQIPDAQKVGVSAERLRLTYVKALVGERRHVQDHMVLSYHATPETEPWVLDNLIDDILPVSMRRI